MKLCFLLPTPGDPPSLNYANDGKCITTISGNFRKNEKSEELHCLARFDSRVYNLGYYLPRLAHWRNTVPGISFFCFEIYSCWTYPYWLYAHVWESFLALKRNHDSPSDLRVADDYARSRCGGLGRNI